MTDRIAQVPPHWQEDHNVKTIDGDLFRRPGKTSVGIDQSLAHFALCAFSPVDNSFFIWLFDPKVKSPITHDQEIERLLVIERYLGWTFMSLRARGCELSRICMENYSFGSKGRAVFNLGELGGLVKTTVAKQFSSDKPKLRYPLAVPPTSLKSFVCNNGHAKKNEVMLAAYKKWKVDFGGDDNATDAYVLARIAACVEDGKLVTTAYESEIIAKIRKIDTWTQELHSKIQTTITPTRNKNSRLRAGDLSSPRKRILRTKPKRSSV